MPSSPVCLRVFLSSPADVADERALARKLLKDELPYDPLLRGRVTFDVVSWDDPEAQTPMLATATPQEAVNRFLTKPSECDIVIVVLWGRLGTSLDPNVFRKPTGEPYQSGTEWEFEDAFNAQRRPAILVYRRTEEPKVSLKDPDLPSKAEQLQRVERFFERVKNPDGSFRLGMKEYRTATDFQEQLENDLKHLLRERLKLDRAEPAAVPEPWSGSPYPGLRAFMTEEAPIFFGRGREVDALIERLRDSSHRFLAVVGSSGSGKSSLVRAGLLPRLAQGAIEGSQHWRFLTLMPGATGDNPFLTLAIEFATSLPPSKRKPPVEIARLLAEAPDRITDFAASMLAECATGAVVVLFVDQLEELFTSVAGAHRASFADLLAHAAADPRLRVLATLRADFMPRCTDQPALSTLFQVGTFTLGPPGPVELGEMISKPADRAGLELEDGLADELVQDAGSDPGALPVLAFSLEELYRRSSDFDQPHAQPASSRRLTIAGYNAVGRLRGAIGQRAEGLLADFRETAGPHLDTTLQQLFRSLVQVDATGAAARRRAFRIELSKIQSANLQLADDLLARLIQGRLLVADTTDGRETVTLAHEALFEGWPALRDWLDQNRREMQRLQRLLLSLRAPNVEDRSYAVKALADMGPAAAEATLDLITSLRDEEPAVRASAAQALGGIGTAAADAIPTLIEALADPEMQVRSSVAQALGQIGSLAEQAIPALMDLLRDSESEVRASSVRGLAGIGAASVPAVPALAAILKDPKSAVRLAAAQALGGMGPAAAEAISSLVEALDDTESEVRAGAAQALGEIGPAASDAALALIGLAVFDADSNFVRPRAAEALGHIGPAAVPTLVHALRHPSPEIRSRAAETLAKMGKAAADGVPALIDALADTDPSVRYNAAAALGEIGTTAAAAGQALFTALSDPDANVRYNAAEAFGKIGPTAAEAVPALTANVGYGRPWVRASVVEALGQIGPAAREAASALVATLADGEPMVRANAAEALGKIGAFPVEAGPALAAALGDTDLMVRLQAAMAFAKLGTEPVAIPALITALTDAEPLVAHQAAEALGKMAPASADAVPALVAALDYDGFRSFVSFSAARALEKIGLPAGPALITALGHAEYGVRSKSSQILGKIGSSAVPALIKALGNEQSQVRSSAARALAEVGSAAVPALTDVLNDTTPSIRLGAARALGLIGRPAAPALPALGAMLDDEDQDVKRAARAAFDEVRLASPVAKNVNGENDESIAEGLGIQKSALTIVAAGMAQSRKLAKICLELAGTNRRPQ